MSNFADSIDSRIKATKSFLIAGFDPVFEAFPKWCETHFTQKSVTNDDAIFDLLVGFHELALEAIQNEVAAIKPNIAFFEQYGIPGLRAFQHICASANARGIPVVADIKRGDIGSTAKAYSNAFLGKVQFRGKSQRAFAADAITVSPYLGFDTIQTYFDDCREYGRGLFVLVKTSNPGSSSLQGINTSSGLTLADHVADFVAKHASDFMGHCGYSSLGAVVGATYPQEAVELRKRMPSNMFLIPGMGAQGGTAKDAVAGFSAQKSAALINVSRGLLAQFGPEVSTPESLKAAICARAQKFNAEVAAALLEAIS